MSSTQNRTVPLQVFRGRYYGETVAVKRLFCSVWEQDKFQEFFKSEVCVCVRARVRMCVSVCVA